MRPTKLCPECKQTFPATTEYFHKNKRNKDNLCRCCKQCRTEKTHQYNQKHQIERRKYQKRYYAEHKEELQQYKANHKEEIQRFRKQHYRTIRGFLQRVWYNMLHRCNNPEDKDYKNYGGRGIQVKFVSFEDFYDYVVNILKADPRGLTIDRIDNDGHYEKDNIVFVTKAENNKNRRRNYG